MLISCSSLSSPSIHLPYPRFQKPSFSWNAGWWESQTSHQQLSCSLANGTAQPYCYGNTQKPHPAQFCRSQASGRKGCPRNWWRSRSSAGDEEDIQGTAVWYPLRAGTQKEQHVLHQVVTRRKDLIKASLEAGRPAVVIPWVRADGSVH